TQTGVYIGVAPGEYSLISHPQKETDSRTIFQATGTSMNVVSGRVSYVLGLEGPCISVDTACSSSLVAVHLACQGLKNDECDIGIAGGVNTILTPYGHIAMTIAQALSPEGQCKTFDESADGYVRSEGCGIVILKRLVDALNDGDNVRAIICGTSVSQDGASGGLTVPNGNSQEKLLLATLRKAGVLPNQVDYIEAHGTGTPLGDPIEVGAIGRVYGIDRSPGNPLIIGSVKTNIGHTESAAGVAGLIKVVLSMENSCIPANLNFKKLNSRIDLDSIPAKIPTENMVWKHDSQRTRYAAVSSFGFSGTISHLVMKESTAVKPNKQRDDVSDNALPALLTISAKNEAALKEMLTQYQKHIKKYPEQSICDIAYTTNIGRSHFKKYRLAIVANDHEQLSYYLNNPQKCILPNNATSNNSNTNSNKIAFLFTGQGSQYLDMAKVLYENHQEFKDTLDYCAKVFGKYSSVSLLDIIFSKSDDDEHSKKLKTERLNQTIYSQPAIFVIEYALAKLWESWGICANYVMGHSVGEYVAATISGIMSLEDGLKLIYYRGKLMQELPENVGGMLVVKSNNIAYITNTVNDFVKSSESTNIVDIAAFNSPNQIVLSGHLESLSSLMELFKNNAIDSQLLPVSHAFHSSLMNPMLEEFEKIASSIQYNEIQKYAMVSNLDGKLLYNRSKSNLGNAEDENDNEYREINSSYWKEHITSPVDFLSGIKTLQKLGCTTFIEIGPHPILLSLGMQSLKNEDNANPTIWLPSLKKRVNDWHSILESLGNIYTNGANINWKAFHSANLSHLNKVQLPSYPFQRQRYWPEVANQNKSLVNSDWLYEIAWEPEPLLVPNKKPIVSDPNRALILLLPNNEVQKEIVDIFEASGYERYFIVMPGDEFYQKDNVFVINPEEKSDYIKCLDILMEMNCDLVIEKIIHMWSLDDRAIFPIADEVQQRESIKQAQVFGCMSIMYTLQAMIQNKKQFLSELCVITLRSQNAFEGKYINLGQTTINGLLKSARIECPDIIIKHIDLGCKKDICFIPAELTTLPATANNSSNENDNTNIEKDIAYYEGNRFVSHFVHHKVIAVKELEFNSHGSYLITGGMGGLGLKICEWLIKKGAGCIILMGRNLPKDTDSILKIADGTASKIELVQCDVSNEVQLKETLKFISTTMLPLKGIFHAELAFFSQKFSNLKAFIRESFFSSNVWSTWFLYETLQELNVSLDHLVLFSSIASSMGTPGQANYAAADSFLDGISQYLNAVGLKTISINWGPWDDIGMAANLQQKMENIGIKLLPPQSALFQLEYCLSSNRNQLSVVDKVTKAASIFSSDLLDQLMKENEYQRKETLKEFVLKTFRNVLNLKATDNIEEDMGFFQYGMDSLLIVEFRNKMQAQIGNYLTIPSTIAFDNPNILSLTNKLENLLFEKKKDNTTFSKKEVMQINNENEFAIIGMSCKLPSSDNVEQLWKVLSNNKNAISLIPQTRWDTKEFENEICTTQGGFINEMEEFDAMFFNISPKEALLMDPQQRLVLELSWVALEDANLIPSALLGTQTGVYIGVAPGEYSLISHPQKETDSRTIFQATGTSMNVVSGRVSYV
ncbi:MAG: SDR family NAD(P)-dependent oxidoreductase, partial [Candidatus Bathyarchaeia archaeon]